MTMAAYTSAAFTNNAGVATIADLASIEVRRESDNQIAVIYPDAEGASPPLGNPFLADADGRFVFYAPGIQKGYQVKATKGANVITLHNQAVGTAAQLDATNIWNATQQERAARRARHFAALNYV